MKAFDYQRATDVATAQQQASGSGSRFLAGGTTQLDLMKCEVERPERLVDITHLPGLDAIHVTGERILLGSLAKMSRVADHPQIRATAPALADSLALAASAQLRNMATLGGNLLQRTRCSYFRDPQGYDACNKRNPGSGCAALDGLNRNHAVLGTSAHCIATYPGDLAVALTAFDAVLHLRAPDGSSRQTPIATFFWQPGDRPDLEHDLAPGELITAIEIPVTPALKRSHYLKVRDRASYEFAAASAAARAHTATAGAAVLEQVAGRFTPYGTWAVRAGTVAAGGFGAPVAGLLVGMMPGRLNDGEQDFIDRMRAEQMRTAPSRVRFTWESDAQGNPVPRGWHTPPGRDSVRVRQMAWDSARQAYTFTTEEEQPVTIIWTPDHSGVHVPTNTGNQHRPILPNPVMVNPLPDSTGLRTTTSPAPDEKSFADYILILPVADIPPIYIYLSKPRNGLPEDGHDYHPAPKTEEITGITGLREAKQKTPKQGGGGKRDRWIDAKGRRIYEWDSQHGELEEYRASDGEHLGSVDYKTGQQLKPAVKGRSIKRYL